MHNPGRQVAVWTEFCTATLLYILSMELKSHHPSGVWNFFGGVGGLIFGKYVHPCCNLVQISTVFHGITCHKTSHAPPLEPQISDIYYLILKFVCAIK
jgi:hypothetical protein